MHSVLLAEGATRGRLKIGAPSRREFLQRLTAAGIAVSALPLELRLGGAAEAAELPAEALTFPGPWQFLLPRPSIILVNDQQLEDLQDPDKQVDLSLSATPNLTTLRQFCKSAKDQGARTIILAFDEFWSQYRKGQGGKPRQLMPDTDEYVQRLAKICETVKAHGLGLEISLLSPLEVGRGYERKTGETGGWVQYREGYRDPKTGQYSVSLWEQRRWTNNKGTVELKRLGVRVLAFHEHRVGGTHFYAVDPNSITGVPTAPEVTADESAQPSTSARRILVRGQGDHQLGDLNRVLVVVSYATPEVDYFSPKSLPFLQALVQQYHAAGIPLNGLYADEMHIQQDWGYSVHHDEGQFTFRYLTRHMAKRFSELYGDEFKDFEKFLVYFCYGQHGFLPNLEARLPAQHVLGGSPEDIQKTFLLRRRYYDLLETTVTDLFARAKEFAEKTYGHELEARAHATWAQSPTCDIWESASQPTPPRQYEYTPDFLWSNTVQQAASACSDYFAWNKFLTGGGNDHAEGGWLDRNYYGIAIACSTGILNRTPYAYAAAWGMPGPVWQRHQAVCDAFGASASPWFQAVQDSQHRDTDVLMLYPLSLVACEERFGSWMTQYAYANYVTAGELLRRGKVRDGKIEMAGRKFGTLTALFEPLPPAGLLEFMEQFVQQGGKVVWSGPPPRLDFSGQAVLDRWQRLLGVNTLQFGVQGQFAGGWQIQFTGALNAVPPQTVLTNFLVDLAYPVEPAAGAEVVARLGRRIVGTHKAFPGKGTATFLGFRPRDDQAASLGVEVRTWFELLRALGAYPGVRSSSGSIDNPSVISRTTPFVACSFPNGTTALAAHYKSIEECWPGGFHRDQKQDDEILSRNPLPPAELALEDFAVNGHRITYKGSLAVAFRLGENSLAAFAGHNCQNITIDGTTFTFAEKPAPLVAWAPVATERKSPRGALMELWAHADTTISIPLPNGASTARLFFQGGAPGVFGAELPCDCSGGMVRFKAEGGWPQKRLFLAAS
jgi:hypothetical protein